MQIDQAETANIEELMSRIGSGLDQFLKFKHEDCWQSEAQWRARLDVPLPMQGVGIDQVVNDLVMHVIPNGSAVPKPGFTSFITTGATSASVLASAAAGIAAPQRYHLNAFDLLEGVCSSGGSGASLLAPGAARQFAFQKRGHDGGADVVHIPLHVYASAESHHMIQRSAGVLGIGPAVTTFASIQ